MSVAQPSLFGAYPWAVGTTSSPMLFGTGYVPQTYSVPLSDAVTGSEADLVSATKPLSETVSLSEARVVALTHLLADSGTLSESVAKTLSHLLADTSSVSDSAVSFSTNKSLQDFLIVKEWLSIRLDKQINWVNPFANANIFDTLYGKYKFGTVLFGGLKPLASWSRNGPRAPSVWTNANGHKYNS